MGAAAPDDTLRLESQAADVPTASANHGAATGPLTLSDCISLLASELPHTLHPTALHSAAPAHAQVCCSRVQSMNKLEVSALMVSASGAWHCAIILV